MPLTLRTTAIEYRVFTLLHFHLFGSALITAPFPVFGSNLHFLQRNASPKVPSDVGS